MAYTKHVTTFEPIHDRIVLNVLNRVGGTLSIYGSGPGKNLC